MIVSGGWQFNFLGRVARVRSLNTPVLVLSALALLRIAWHYRTHLEHVDGPHAWRTLRLATIAGVFAAVMLAPVLYAVDRAYRAGRLRRPADVLAQQPARRRPRFPSCCRTRTTRSAPASFRRSSPRGPTPTRERGLVPFVVIGVVVVAWRRGWSIPRLWGGFSALFALLSLGPFVHIAGMNTYIPGPWALLRYVPLLGLARTPARFTTVLMLMLGRAVCGGAVLAHVRGLRPGGVRILAGVTALLLFELLPVPRVLYSAEVPRVYRHIAAAPDDTRVLELPFGVRDGTSSVGNFTARSQFFQTYHHKMLFGGYLSRVSRRRISEIRRYEMLDALITLSEGGRSTPAARHTGRGRPAFAERWRSASW